jgi:hypothetical protein
MIWKDIMKVHYSVRQSIGQITDPHRAGNSRALCGSGFKPLKYQLLPAVVAALFIESGFSCWNVEAVICTNRASLDSALFPLISTPLHRHFNCATLLRPLYVQAKHSNRLYQVCATTSLISCLTTLKTPRLQHALYEHTLPSHCMVTKLHPLL